MSGLVRLRVARGASWVDYEIAAGEGMTVLDALETLRGSRDPDLRYRHSCHHGSCGTCGARVNGKETLMCLERLDALGPGPVVVEPLRKMEAVGDAAVDPSPLFTSLPAGAGYLRESGLEHGGPVEEGDERGYRRFEACVECGCCVSACPVEGKAFSGPAALAMADRDREERPEREEAALAFAARPDGVGACDSVFACSRACPQGVAPGRRIRRLKASLENRAGGPPLTGA